MLPPSKSPLVPSEILQDVLHPVCDANIVRDSPMVSHSDTTNCTWDLPDIHDKEFRFTFDYPGDGSTYVVLYGQEVVFSGPAAHDPDDYITDSPLGEQFVEISRKLKERYGAKLVDLVPTPRASEMLTDMWGWALKRDWGRKIVREGLGASQF